MNHIVRVGAQITQNRKKGMVLKNIFTNLNTANTLVIVEGQNDSKAIRLLGYTGKLFEINGRKGGFSKLATASEGYKVIVPLFDFDRGGEKLDRAIKQRSNMGGIILNYTIKKKIKLIVPNITHIEDLSNLSQQDRHQEPLI